MPDFPAKLPPCGQVFVPMSRVMRLLSVTAVGAMLAGGNALSAAVPQGDELPQALPGLPPSLQHFRSTRFERLDRSLEDLLNDGFGIVDVTALAAGPGVVLRQGQGRWVFCLLLVTTQPGTPTVAVSQCFAMN